MRKDVKTLGQILSDLGDLLEGLSNVAETGADVLQSVGAKPIGAGKVTYGWSLKTAVGPRARANAERRRVAPAAAPPPRRAESVQEVFDEGDFVRIVMEVPGVEDGDIHFTVSGEELVVETRRRGGKNVVRLRVPEGLSAEGATSSYRNGMFEIVLPKQRGTNGSR